MNIRDINFLPLDLPYAHCDSFEIKKFMDLKGKRTDYDWTKKINDPWNHIVVRIPGKNDFTNEIPGSYWRPDFKKKFPDIIKVVEMMPYQKINYVYLLEQIIEVNPHFDVASKNPLEDQEPATYRISLLMEDQETFYICRDQQCKTMSFPMFPKDTNSWVFSNKNFMHGSKLSTKNLRKILLAIGGILDENKHNELLLKSYQKYHKYIF